MKKKILIVIMIFVALAGCVKKPLESKETINVVQAVNLLDKHDKKWSKRVKGVFEMTIRASGEDNRMGYLNSNLNYRTKYNLTIVLSKNIRKRLTKKYGEDPLKFFIGKKIRVKGEARKIKIYTFKNGKLTNLVYFQSHILLKAIKNIEIIE